MERGNQPAVTGTEMSTVEPAAATAAGEDPLADPLADAPEDGFDETGRRIADGSQSDVPVEDPTKGMQSGLLDMFSEDTEAHHLIPDDMHIPEEERRPPDPPDPFEEQIKTLPKWQQRRLRRQRDE